MTTKQEYEYLKDYYFHKYGSAYMSAMKKLSASFSEAYDEKVYLKDDYVLTPLEKEEVLTYVPEFIDNQNYGNSRKR